MHLMCWADGSRFAGECLQGARQQACNDRIHAIAGGHAHSDASTELSSEGCDVGGERRWGAGEVGEGTEVSVYGIHAVAEPPEATTCDV